MDKISVTYDTRIIGDRFETTTVLPISEQNWERLERRESDIAHCMIEPALVSLEMMLDRIYVHGSIKSVKLVRE